MGVAPTLYFIIGCTGSGKGSLGRVLAERLNGEIISADSMKVYRRMDIGTAKPSGEVRSRIPHHLIDVVEPSEEFSVAEYVRLTHQAIADIHARGRPIFIVGGTPLYIKALSEGLFEGPSADPAIRERLQQAARDIGVAALHQRLTQIDPAAALRIHPNDLRRIVRALEVYEIVGTPISELQVQWDRQRTCYPCDFTGLRWSREEQSRRTNERVRKMLDAGFVEEVRALLAEPLPLSTAARQALGYAEIIDHLQGNSSLAEAVEKIKINTRRLAKAQRTWFRRFLKTDWKELQPDSTAESVAEEWIRSRGSPWSPSLR